MNIWEDGFFGCDMTDEEYDRIGIERVKPILYRREPDLMKTKWWDYRFSHPTRSTYYFAHCYTEAYKRSLARREDFREAQYRKGFKGKDPTDISPREAEGFWKARQFADEHGIPYDFHLARCMEYAEHRDWQKLPRPQQLYGATQSLDGTTMRFEVINAWHKRKLGSLITASHPMFEVVNFKNLPVQVQYQKHLIDTIKDSPNRFLYLGELIVNKRQLSRVVAGHFFGQKYVDSAIMFFHSAFDQNREHNSVSVSSMLSTHQYQDNHNATRN